MSDDRRIDTSSAYAAPKSRDSEALKVEIADLKAQLADKDRQLIKIETNLSAPVAIVAPAMLIAQLKERDSFVREVIHTFFRQGVHYGVPFPNAKDADGKPILMLYKDGADWFASAFGVRPHYTQLRCIEDRTATPPIIAYEYKCELILIATGQIVGDAVGFCTSEEEGYKYRNAGYKCPNCDQETIMRSGFVDQGEQEKGWYCNKKKGGCGAKYAFRAAEIMNQSKPGRSLNLETPAQSHNILSKAEKRAFVLAMRTTFGLNVYFKIFEGLDDDEVDDVPGEMVVNGSATVTESTPPTTVFVVDDKPFVGTDIPGLIDFLLAQYPDLEGKKNHAGNRVWSAFGVKGWPEIVKANVTRAQVMERIEQHMAEKNAIRETE